MTKPKPMWSEEGKDYVIGYMCLIDFECEIGAASGGNKVYPSIEDCKEHRKCTDSQKYDEICGIVEVKVEAIRIVEPGNIPGV